MYVQDTLNSSDYFFKDKEGRWKLKYDWDSAADQNITEKAKEKKKGKLAVPLIKRRHKKSQSTYSKVIDLLESCCIDYSDCLKNPFRGVQGNERSQDLLNKLGSSEKILGVLQCYDFFAPISIKVNNVKFR